VGKDANLPVLAKSPYDVAPNEIKDTAVWGTMLEGRAQPAPAAPRVASAKPAGAGRQDAVLARDLALKLEAILVERRPPPWSGGVAARYSHEAVGVKTTNAVCQARSQRVRRFERALAIFGDVRLGVPKNRAQYANKCRSELCRNCVRSPRNRRETPTFRGSHRGAFCSGKSLNRLREEVFRYHSMSVAGVVFQACAFNHSAISPCLESTTCERSRERLSHVTARLRRIVWRREAPGESENGRSVNLDTRLMLPIVNAHEQPLTLARLERDHIVATLDKLEWRLEGEGGAADVLGIKPSTLRNRMRKHGIRRARPFAEERPDLTCSAS